MSFKDWLSKYSTQFNWASKITKAFIFFSFAWTAIVMYKLNRPYESILIVFAIALFLILNRLDVK